MLQEGNGWKPLSEGDGFTREKSAARTTAIRIHVSGGSGKTIQVRVKDDRFTATADVNVQ